MRRKRIRNQGRSLSFEQIQRLLENKNVIKCSPYSISYSAQFKQQAVQSYQEGVPPSEIFIDAGFDLHVLGRNRARDCVRRWTKLSKAERCTDRWGAKPAETESSHPMTDREKIQYLEAKIDYLKSENAFLAQLRAERVE